MAQLERKKVEVHSSPRLEGWLSQRDFVKRKDMIKRQGTIRKHILPVQKDIPLHQRSIPFTGNEYFG
ncbi:uncharacterized protein PADG_11681 [Paracoccidioides brasiliensis Pb18]|uniref:Uncharacterized protein n=2 Tax=Paracoccidioides brasiliensis TaxID=121759 RepID=A0A0A0HXN1_PARBD|nr:uncharacterized protein PADG_11681 [Paracoccidioides brasiliensis Pb18]KGM92145.1 hypothetical protein PADG_11681 [Paracoccidioides brasiliensis Pb18]ODH45050.1 hypothetical protein ACO22_00442 [Paracoccidioides brasiliensis]